MRFFNPNREWVLTVFTVLSAWWLFYTGQLSAEQFTVIISSATAGFSISRGIAKKNGEG
jgi:hypothetical protein